MKSTSLFLLKLLLFLFHSLCLLLTLSLSLFFDFFIIFVRLYNKQHTGSSLPTKQGFEKFGSKTYIEEVPIESYDSQVYVGASCQDEAHPPQEIKDSAIQYLK